MLIYFIRTTTYVSTHPKLRLESYDSWVYLQMNVFEKKDRVKQ